MPCSKVVFPLPTFALWRSGLHRILIDNTTQVYNSLQHIQRYSCTAIYCNSRLLCILILNSLIKKNKRIFCTSNILKHWCFETEQIWLPLWFPFRPSMPSYPSLAKDDQQLARASLASHRIVVSQSGDTYISHGLHCAPQSTSNEPSFSPQRQQRR